MALSIAQALRRRGVRLALGLILLALNLALLNVLAARHHLRLDWTADRVFSLSPKTVAALQRQRAPLELIAIASPRTTPLYAELDELLRRFAARSRRVSVIRVDPDADPARADVLAQTHAVEQDELREGAVVVVSGTRRRVVPVAAMAQHRLTPTGRRELVGFRGEAALLEGLLAVRRRRGHTVCFTTGHGEASITARGPAGYAHLADAIRRDGLNVKPLPARALVAGARGCKIIVVGGPRRAFAAVEREALDRFLRHGGRLLLLLGPVLDRRASRQRRIGLERWLRGWGVQVRDTIVVDEVAIPGEQPLMTWGTRDGYAASHPVGRAMMGKLTVWPLTREVRPVGTAREGLAALTLVRTSPRGWAESDLGSLRGERPLRLDPAVDSAGPVSVAVAVAWQRTRLVVLGTERGVLNRRIGGKLVRDFNRDLVLAVLGWLGGDLIPVAVGPRRPEQAALTLTEAQLGQVRLLCVAGLPALSLCVALIVWWRRRR